MPRIERDTLGEVVVPDDALYGAQTQRAVENYPVSGLREHPAFIRSFLLIKKAAALANRELGALDPKRADAIAGACDEVLRNFETHQRQFVVDVFQAGAGTSFNMNCNEVLANLANVALGGRVGEYVPVHPNDHVNMSQSTNDVFPTAIRIATLLLLRELIPALESLTAALQAKGEEFDDVIKSGRTHLQDAVPVTLGQEFRAWAAAVRRATRLLDDAAGELRQLGIGGTATGTGINTPRGFRFAVVRHLSALAQLDLASNDDLRESMQSQLPVVAVSAALRNLALELTRITNDLRLLASGPLTGLAEIRLPAVQPGSSIMPGKVNPSLLECMNQICFHIVGADSAVAYASQAGQLELNVMMPLMAFEVTFSIEILKNFLPVFVEKCIRGIEADRERCEAYYVRSPALATVLNPIIGYTAAAEIARESARSGRPVAELLRERNLLSEEEIARIFTPQFLAGQADR
ncbi:MAG TPA: aspartate ammonia-lyase [Thermoanaerobaculia bacterium]|nr:aspartate ammonia-lyase [Thermoanaerobaculia bacterium]